MRLAIFRRNSPGFCKVGLIMPLVFAGYVQGASSSSGASSSAAAEPVKKLQTVFIEAETEGSYSDPVTVSATKMIMSLRETPQSVSVITQQQIEDWGAVNIKEILSHTTGFYVSTGSSQDRPSYNVRGGTANLIQIDGVQQFPGGRRPTVNGDSIAYERVEIIRGANGLVTGSGEPTATINLIRKRANSTGLTGSAGVSAGSWNNYRQEVDVSSPLSAEGTIRGRIAAAHYDRDSFIDRYGQEKSSLYATVESDVTENTLVRAGVEIADTKSRGSINTNAAPYYFADGSKINASRGYTGMTAKWSGWPLDEETYFVGLDHGFDNGWHLNSIVTYNTIHMQGGDLFFLYPGSATQPIEYFNRDGSSTLGFSYSAIIGSSKDVQKTFDVTLQGPYELFGRTHDLIFSYNNFNRERTSYGFEANQAAVPLTGWNGFTWTGDVARYPFKDLGRSNLGITESDGGFVATRVSLADPLKLILGARLTNWETNSRNYDPKTGAYIPPKTNAAPSNHKLDGEVTPYAGLVYDVTENIALYTSYTDAFVVQNNYDANDNLINPIVGESYEIGAKGEFIDGLLNVSFAYFENEKDNLAILDPAYPVNYKTPANNTPYISSGKGNKAKGYELEVSGQLSENWNIYGGVSRTTTENNAGVRINTDIPQTMFNLYSTYGFSGTWEKLTLGGGINWQSEYSVMSRRPSGAPRNANGALPTVAEKRVQSSVMLANVMARYDLNDYWSVSFNANNLFDEEYFSSISSGDGSVTWGDPANYRVSVKYRW